MSTTEHAYICIDLKSFYASVECVKRKLDPLTTNLLVADEGRSEQTICLAVSPSLKALGVPARPRLFEAREVIRRYEIEHKEKVTYLVACPHMAEYERISAEICEPALFPNFSSQRSYAPLSSGRSNFRRIQ